MSFNEQYSKIYELVKPDIEKVSQKLIKEINVKEPLQSSLKNFLMLPSKHIRSLLAFLYLKANNIEINENQIELQTAIELVHNASLIHDDIIDNSNLRRNHKTLNNEFDNKLAVISGDYLLSAALKKINALRSFELIELFSSTLENMSNGEINQYFSKFQLTSIEEYIRKSQQKTASLFCTAIEGAAIVSGCLDKETAREFSLNFGTAFQIRDDLINAKTTKTDISDGIYTAPVILGHSPEDITSGIEKTLKLLNNYICTSVNAIKNIEENKYKLAILELLELLKNE